MKLVKSIAPFALLAAALVFMTQFKQVESLSANEEVHIETFQKQQEETEAQPVTRGSDNMEAVSNEAEKEYAITSDGSVVRVYDEEGQQVYETSLADWEANKADYYEKYQLGS
ncbi:UNVERIFIED_CONTAM: hypothetical protein N8J90_09180 [Halobacillus marinus]